LKEHSISYADVASVSLRVNFLVLEVTGKRHPKVGVDGKFSIYHCVAVALIDKQVTEKQFTEQRVNDSTVVDLSDHVTANVDSGVAADEVYIELTLKDGRKFQKHVEHALGSLKCPLSDMQLEDKFQDLVASYMPKPQSKA
jgi:2-methylcitrate dehydratase PrpD